MTVDELIAFLQRVREEQSCGGRQIILTGGDGVLQWVTVPDAAMPPLISVAFAAHEP